jgi:flagellar protein FlaG
MTTPPSLDVIQLFPFPTEQAALAVSSSSASESPSAVASEARNDSSTRKPAQGSAEQLTASLQQLNTGLQNYGIEFEFSEPGNHLVTRVVDRESGELIRQIPSEEVLRMAQRMESRIGLLLQEKA